MRSPAHAEHRAYVLVGRGTYSSAVLFANTVQDFGFGTLVGEGENIRTTQSGGIQQIKLPSTGLVLWSPRLVLVRPSGKRSSEWLTPDLAAVGDPLDPQAMIQATLGASSPPGGEEIGGEADESGAQVRP